MLCFIGALLSMPAAPQPVKVCPEVEIQLINVSAEMERKASLDTRTETIEIAPAQVSNPKFPAAEEALMAVAVGPILGSMDSPNVKTEVTCTASGFLLTGTISRSAEFHGAALQNVNWRPKIAITLLPRQPEITVQVSWKMRLTTGIELYHAQTPPYSERTFPITLTKVIHLNSRHN